ncbi:MAG: ABC transporter permease [Acidobacteria bacterium]|nr:ABC transporter permease [Acidobacteriota bacterium]
MNDVRDAVRTLAKNLGFTAAAILTLALGIGGNFAIFSVVHAVFFRPLPFPDEQRLVRLYDATLAPGGQVYRGNLLPPRWDAIARRARSFDRITAQRPENLTLVGSDAPAMLDGTSVSPGTLALFGVAPAIGRAFTRDQERLGSAAGVALISDRLWKRRFSADTGVIGRAHRARGVRRGTRPPLAGPARPAVEPVGHRVDRTRRLPARRFGLVSAGPPRVPARAADRSWRIVTPMIEGRTCRS